MLGSLVATTSICVWLPVGSCDGRGETAVLVALCLLPLALARRFRWHAFWAVGSIGATVSICALWLPDGSCDGWGTTAVLVALCAVPFGLERLFWRRQTL